MSKASKKNRTGTNSAEENKEREDGMASSKELIQLLMNDFRKWEETHLLEGGPEAEAALEKFRKTAKETKLFRIFTSMNAINEEIQDVFHFYDTQGDGKIAASQIPTALRAMNLIPSEALVEKMMKQWEKKLGIHTRITVQEFLPILRNVEKECGRAPNFQEFQALLGHFDREGTGHIALVELRTMLQNSGEKMNVHEIDQLISGVEMVEGKINIVDFLKNHLQMEG